VLPVNDTFRIAVLSSATRPINKGQLTWAFAAFLRDFVDVLRGGHNIDNSIWNTGPASQFCQCELFPGQHRVAVSE